MLRRKASAWLVRLQSGRDPEIERKFQRWHDEDPAHAAAFARIRQTYDRAAVLRHSELASVAPSVAQESSGEPSYAWAVAAVIALLVAAGLYVSSGSLFGPSGTEAVMLTTKVGEIRHVRLADGTRVTLDTATSVQVEIGRSERRAVVKSGRARFNLARSDSPFVIEAGDAIVTAGDAIIDVAKIDRNSTVDVLAGNADVRSRIQGSNNAVAVTAGEELVAGSGMTTRYALAAPDWTHGMLEFDATPLDAAVAIANRYSGQKIVVQSGLGQLRVTGAFRAGDPGALANALAEAFQLSAVRDEKGDFVLSRKSAVSPSK